jgi:cytosine deaminase
MRDDDQNFVDEARAEAQKGLASGGLPIGSVVVRGGVILGRGHNRRVQENRPMEHAEINALNDAGPLHSYAGVTLYSTLMPCFLCSGAAVQFGIKRVVVGEATTFPGGAGPGGTSPDFLRAHGVEVVVLEDPACIAMMRELQRTRPELWNQDIGVEA